MRCSEPGGMALLGICHRTIHTNQRPQNKRVSFRKPLPINPASYGERFRIARVTQGYTQTGIARRFGVSLSTVKFWEQNRTQPNPEIRSQVEVFIRESTPPVPNSLPTPSTSTVNVTPSASCTSASFLHLSRSNAAMMDVI
jgi:DNA-binding transcriptional regulator YiaG